MIEQSERSEAFSVSKVLSLKDLRKVYGGTVAADGISFEVGRNEIVGLLGPNEAGRTTITNTILGVLEPTAGTVHIKDLDVAAHCSHAVCTGLIPRYSAELLSQKQTELLTTRQGGSILVV